jgi:ElaB/YqjD/DUF883 family membrane-anchored ribosome-binding protein
MIGEGEPLETASSPTKLNQAMEAVQAAVQTVSDTTQSLTDAVERGRRGAPLDRLAHWAREAPLHALAVAFLLGVMLGRRRR